MVHMGYVQVVYNFYLKIEIPYNCNSRPFYVQKWISVVTESLFWSDCLGNLSLLELDCNVNCDPRCIGDCRDYNVAGDILIIQLYYISNHINNTCNTDVIINQKHDVDFYLSFCWILSAFLLTFYWLFS